MPKGQSSPGSSEPGIRIDIEGISPETRLSDLTVQQCVELLAQVIAQAPSRESVAKQRKSDFVARLADVLRSDASSAAAIRKSLSELSKAVPQLLLELLHQMNRAPPDEPDRKERAGND